MEDVDYTCPLSASCISRGDKNKLTESKTRRKGVLLEGLKNGRRKGNKPVLVTLWGEEGDREKGSYLELSNSTGSDDPSHHHVSCKSKDSSHVDHSGSWGYSSDRPKSIEPKEKGSCTSGPLGSLVKP